MLIGNRLSAADKRRLAMLYANNQGGNLRQQLLDGAPFLAELTHTAVPQRAATGTTATFTRATTATVQNNDGYLVTALAGEARFQGARGVRNLIPTTSEDYSNAVWTKGAVTVGDSIANPVSGSVNALKIKEDNTSADHRIFVGTVGSLVVGNVYVYSFYAKAAERSYIRLTSASGALMDVVFNLGTGAVQSNVAGVGSITSVAGGWYRCSVKATATVATTTNMQFRLQSDATTTSYAGTTGSGAYAWGAQLEDVTAQTTQTAGEYVSVGVESAPYYHGSMVDGVKCFDTDIAGNAIPSTTLLGYSAEGARTNLQPASDDLSNATYYTAFETTVTANQSVGSDGAVSMDKVAETSATNVHLVRTVNIATSINTTYTCSIDLKQGTQRYATLLLWGVTSSTNREIFTVDLSNGTISTAAGVPANVSVTPVGPSGEGIYRCSITGTTSGTDVNINFYVYLSNNGTNSPSYAGDTGKYIYAGKVQVEAGSFASSYIATTTAAVTRNADVLTYSSAGNILDASGWCYAEYSSPAMTLLNAMAVVGDGGGTARGPLITRTITSGAHMFDGTNLNAGAAGTPANNVILTAASTWGGVVATVGVDGVLGAQGPYDGSYGLTSLGIGYGAVNMFGTIRNVRIGQRQLSASEMQAVTS